MNPISFAILRLLTHVTMFLGANENAQVVCGMIQPNIVVDALADFLLNHIKLDIASLQRLTGRSVDDVLLLMHMVLHSLTETYNNEGAVDADVLTLITTDAKNSLGGDVCERCLSPIDTSRLMCNTYAYVMLKGSDPLLCLLFEIHTHLRNRLLPQLYQEVPTVWRFRSRISMDHLTTVFQTKMGKRTPDP
ncbi:E3 ubiquitin-protein ligase rnf213-alpha-like [Argopecten irradians]|uniref:E3 ubiquitin-protein ligase rnf213-alpha-like n=1 Tax=Argopecten irradians TaxID=31199 RepID=UPI00371A6C50